MSAVSNDVLNIIYNVFGTRYCKHNSSKNQISYDCPVCDGGKHKGNLEINYGQLVMKCWKCHEEIHGLSGSLRTLVKQYGSKKDLQLYDVVTEDYRPVYDKKGFIENYKPNIKLPKEFIRMATAKRNREFFEAYNYLVTRGITDEAIDKYDIGYCTEGIYAGRIIIPSYDKDGDLNYFVARSYVGHFDAYKNPEVTKTEVIINNLAINWDSTVFIVEGVFDMIGLGVTNTIPLLGKVLHDKLFYEIITKAKGNIVICLDPDAIKNAIRMYKKLNDTVQLHNKVRIMILPGDDDISKINELYGRDGVIKEIRKARQLSFGDYIKYGFYGL